MNNTIKIIFIGESTTGKTSIVQRMKLGSFDENSISTIGSCFVQFNNEGQNCTIWDTAGQERYNALLPMYFKNAQLVIFVFDVSKVTSINYIKIYITHLQNMDNYKIIFIGNKIDLVTEDVINIFKEKISLLDGLLPVKIYDYIFVSAKKGNNFDMLKKLLYKCGKEITPNTNFNFNDNPITLTNVIKEDNIIDDSCGC